VCSEVAAGGSIFTSVERILRRLDILIPQEWLMLYMDWRQDYNRQQRESDIGAVNTYQSLNTTLGIVYRF